MQARLALRDALGRLILFLCAACLGAGCKSAPKPAEGRAFRVMTYNIHHGEGLDGKVDLQRIADLIRREGADVVALQEVDKGVERTARRDFPAELAALTGLTCVFSNNYSFQGGEYGNAVLTRFPVQHATNTHYVEVNETEQRGLLQLTLAVEGRPLVFMATHLDYRPNDAARWSNVGEIEEIVRHSALPLTRPSGDFSPSDGGKDGVRGRAVIILCGDFNDVPASRVCRRLNEALDDAWARAGQGEGFTIPAQQPRKRIDYIWVSKTDSLVPVKAWVPQSEASDHLPVVVELRWQ